MFSQAVFGSAVAVLAIAGLLAARGTVSERFSSPQGTDAQSEIESARYLAPALLRAVQGLGVYMEEIDNLSVRDFYADDLRFVGYIPYSTLLDPSIILMCSGQVCGAILPGPSALRPGLPNPRLVVAEMLRLHPSATIGIFRSCAPGYGGVDSATVFDTSGTPILDTQQLDWLAAQQSADQFRPGYVECAAARQRTGAVPMYTPFAVPTHTIPPGSAVVLVRTSGTVQQ